MRPGLDRLLCADACALVHEHLCAMRIQATTRRFFVRHARRRAWCALRRELLCALSARQFDALHRSYWVRHEWRTEPTSWLEALEAEPGVARVIVDEVARGLWALRPRASPR